jgi:hypothetical protein
VQAVNAPASSLHWNVEPLAVEVNENVAELDETLPEGPEVIVVSGARVLTVTVTAFEAWEVFPAASVAFAVYVCDPSATPDSVLLHAPLASAVVVPTELAPSETVTVLFASAVPAIVTLPVLFVLPFAGLVIAGAAGGTVSTVQVLLAGVGSVFPAASVARTRKVCEPFARPL